MWYFSTFMSMTERIQQLQFFSFLFSLTKRQNEELMKHCSAVQEKLMVNSKLDIDKDLWGDEILACNIRTVRQGLLKL